MENLRERIRRNKIVGPLTALAAVTLAIVVVVLQHPTPTFDQRERRKQESIQSGQHENSHNEPNARLQSRSILRRSFLKVTDLSRRPVPHANVRIEIQGSKHEGFTDRDGLFGFAWRQTDEGVDVLIEVHASGFIPLREDFMSDEESVRLIQLNREDR